MTFSYYVKNEILDSGFTSYTQCISELIGIVINNSFHYRCDNNELIIMSDNEMVVKYIKKIFEHISMGSCDINNFKNKDYVIKLNNYYVYKLISYLKEDFNKNLTNLFVKGILDKNYFVKGLFLYSGSLINPNNSYHLEFCIYFEELSIYLNSILHSFNIKSKILFRKDRFIVYIKEADSISELLKVIGTHDSVLEFENIRVLKDYSNNKNRIKNCIQANEDKLIIASVKQVRAIITIKNTIGLSGLSSKLKEMAEVRLKYKEASLKELGTYLNPPIGKSGVLHRLKKLEEIASELEKS